MRLIVARVDGQVFRHVDARGDVTHADPGEQALPADVDVASIQGKHLRYPLKKKGGNGGHAVVDVDHVVAACPNAPPNPLRGKEIIGLATLLSHDLHVDVMAEATQRLDLFLDEDAAIAVTNRPKIGDSQDAKLVGHAVSK